MTVPHSKKVFGQNGEQLAVQYLLKRGYTILGTNWHCAHGELDIIAQQGEMIVFVEVRTRHANSSEPAFASITPSKETKLMKSAYMYLADHDLSEQAWRIDVIAIGVPRSGAPIVDHTEDALGW